VWKQYHHKEPGAAKKRKFGLSRTVQPVIPAWSAGIQANMDVFPDASLRVWMPAIHAGMTATVFPCFLGEREIMHHFVVTINVNCARFSTRKPE
jgi:hypothetical protein